MHMNKNSKIILAQNLDLLMGIDGYTQTSLAKKSGVNQKTIGNMLNPETTKNGPTLSNISAVAKVFNLETWHLLVPEQPIEVLKSKEIEDLVMNYSKIDQGGRKNLNRISENETRYICDTTSHD